MRRTVPMKATHGVKPVYHITQYNTIQYNKKQITTILNKTLEYSILQPQQNAVKHVNNQNCNPNNNPHSRPYLIDEDDARRKASGQGEHGPGVFLALAEPLVLDHARVHAQERRSAFGSYCLRKHRLSRTCGGVYVRVCQCVRVCGGITRSEVATCST